VPTKKKKRIEWRVLPVRRNNEEKACVADANWSVSP